MEKDIWEPLDILTNNFVWIAFVYRWDALVPSEYNK